MDEKRPFTRQQRLEAAKYAMMGLLAHYGNSKDLNTMFKLAVEYGDKLLQQIETQDETK